MNDSIETGKESLLLKGIRVCVFDAYGTLFDYASAVNRCRDLIGEHFQQFNTIWREKQLQYTWLRSLQGGYSDFWNVTVDALDFTMATLRISDASLRERLMNLYLTLDPYPEVRAVLKRLKAAGLQTAILSNGTRPMLAAAVENAQLAHLFDAILSVDDVRVYKPHPDVYRLAVDRFATEPSTIAFQSSNAWDAYAASAFGMRVVWCNRYGQQPERLPGRPDREVDTLADLPAILNS